MVNRGETASAEEMRRPLPETREQRRHHLQPSDSPKTEGQVTARAAVSLQKWGPVQLGGQAAAGRWTARQCVPAHHAEAQDRRGAPADASQRHAAGPPGDTEKGFQHSIILITKRGRAHCSGMEKGGVCVCVCVTDRETER